MAFLGIRDRLTDQFAARPPGVDDRVPLHFQPFLEQNRLCAAAAAVGSLDHDQLARASLARQIGHGVTHVAEFGICRSFSGHCSPCSCPSNALLGRSRPIVFQRLIDEAPHDLLLFADALGRVDFGQAVFSGDLGVFIENPALEKFETADQIGASPRSIPAS